MTEIRKIHAGNLTVLLMAELLALASQHEGELKVGTHDLDWYLWALSTNYYLMMAAFDGEKPVGYCGWHITPLANRRDIVHGVMDVIYLDPRYRGGFSALNLIRRSLDELKLSGVTKAFAGGPQAVPGLDRLLEYVGMGNPEIFRSKEL